MRLELRARKMKTENTTLRGCGTEPAGVGPTFNWDGIRTSARSDNEIDVSLPSEIFHFTPTSSSWLNMVERFFRDLTQNRLRRGVFRDVPELVEAVEGYNDNSKSLIWTAKASDILSKVKRARRALDNVQSV